MTRKEMIAWCDRQIKQGYEPEVLKAIKTALKKDLKTLETPAIYSQCLQVYADFLRGRNIPLIMDGRQGNALKSIIGKLGGLNTQMNDEQILNAWDFILRHWERTGDWIGRQIKLSDIDRNLLEILDKIRNGASKKQNHLDQAQRFHQELTKQ